MNENYYAVGYCKGDNVVRLITGYLGAVYETPEEAIREHKMNPDALVFQITPYCTEGLDPW